MSNNCPKCSSNQIYGLWSSSDPITRYGCVMCGYKWEVGGKEVLRYSLKELEKINDSNEYDKWLSAYNSPNIENLVRFIEESPEEVKKILEGAE